MIKAKQTQEAHAATSSMSIPLASAFLKETERWMGVHTDFLTSMEAMMTEWVRRQREAFDTSSRSIRKIYDCRDIIGLIQAQHEWVSDCLHWTAGEIRAVGCDAAEITRKTTERLSASANGRSNGQLGRPPAETKATTPMQVAAD
jgi:hypothetical protein